MKAMAVFITALLVLLIAATTLLPAKEHDNTAFQFGEFKISAQGVLSIRNQSTHYLIVPQDKIPANLVGIAAVNLDEKMYVARFFEPGGIGVEGFFDICFRLKNGQIFTSKIENAASIERIKDATYVKSCSYIFDSEQHVLLKIDCSNAGPMKVEFVDHLKPYSEDTP
jgi:hypothetical protein